MRVDAGSTVGLLAHMLMCSCVGICVLCAPAAHPAVLARGSMQAGKSASQLEADCLPTSEGPPRRHLTLIHHCFLLAVRAHLGVAFNAPGCVFVRLYLTSHKMRFLCLAAPLQRCARLAAVLHTWRVPGVWDTTADKGRRAVDVIAWLLCASLALSTPFLGGSCPYTLAPWPCFMHILAWQGCSWGWGCPEGYGCGCIGANFILCSAWPAHHLPLPRREVVP